VNRGITNEMRFLTTILILASLTGLGQNRNPIKIGFGIVAIRDTYDGSKTVTIYSDKNVTTKIEDFKLSGHSEKVLPYYFKSDYGLCYFVCLEKTNDYYRVLINDKDEGFLKNDQSKYFVSWESLLVNKTVERLDLTANPIRKEPGNNEAVVNLNFKIKVDRLKVIEVIEIKGESWVKVYYSKSGNVEWDGEMSDDVGEGWIKWKSGDKLLVDILLLC
jgi:hypothetical protein